MSDKPPCACIEEEPSGWTYNCCCSNSGDTAYAASWCTAKNMKANADTELTALRDRVKVLEEVLRPFARVEECVTGAADTDNMELWFPEGSFVYRFIWADFRRARAALEAKP